jgi:NADH-quinone oxidoreductase subunit L
VDSRVIDGALTGVGRVIASFAEGFRRMQTGYVRSYGVMFLFGAVLLLSVVVVRVS